MASTHFKVSIVKSSANQSAVAAAAYQSGSRLYRDADMHYHNYTSKTEVIYETILLPAHAPACYKDRLHSLFYFSHCRISDIKNLSRWTKPHALYFLDRFSMSDGLSLREIKASYPLTQAMESNRQHGFKCIQKHEPCSRLIWFQIEMAYVSE